MRKGPPGLTVSNVQLITEIIKHVQIIVIKLLLVVKIMIFLVVCFMSILSEIRLQLSHERPHDLTDVIRK